MRVEIEIADELPEARILGAVNDPRAYLLELVRIDRGSKTPTDPDKLPDYTKIFADARNCPSVFKTKEEVDQYIDSLRND